MSRVLSGVRRRAGRAAAVLAVVTGVTVAVGAAPSGATIAASCGTVAFTPGLPDNDCGNEFAADALGNVYTLTGTNYAIERYSTSTHLSSGLGSATFGYCSFFTADAAGDVYVWNSATGVIDEVSSSGFESVVTTSFVGDNLGPLAVSPAGALVVYDNTTDSLYTVSGGARTLLHSVGIAYANSIAVGQDGSVYVAQYDSCGGGVDRVTASGVTAVGTGWCEPESIAVDGAGNVYVANEYSSSLVEVPAAGTQDVLSDVPSGGEGCGDEVFVGGSTLYYVQECNEYDLYTLNVTPLVAPAAPSGLKVTSTLQTSPLAQTLSAMWNPVSFARSYTCTLLYGFATPSAFTVTTTQSQCWFTGLSPTTPYGVQVVANFLGATSPPVSAFASPPPLPAPPPPPGPKKHTIVCQKKHGTARRFITAVHPTCPAGWHRVG
ncbi:MAG TPA: hypothetical protein VGS61_04020 [Acidimicrobiales bacterium]|nr:hypothetical protein [Acidimicrobiales bacterium]